MDVIFWLNDLADLEISEYIYIYFSKECHRVLKRRTNVRIVELYNISLLVREKNSMRHILKKEKRKIKK